MTGITPDPLALDTRVGLPAEMAVLARAHPREGWTGHPNWSGLTAFWLDRHGLFRTHSARLAEETEAMLDRRTEPVAYGNRLARLGSAFLGELDGHHRIEDAHYFPVLKAREPRVAAAFDLLDADHHALDARIHALAEAANRVLAALRGGAPALAETEAFRTTLEAFGRPLERHLLDEEEIVIPVILVHGADLA